MGRSRRSAQEEPGLSARASTGCVTSTGRALTGDGLSVWQLGAAGGLAIGLGALGVLAGTPIIALGALLLGPAAFAGLRTWNRTRRKTQFLASAMPRAYLPPPR